MFIDYSRIKNDIEDLLTNKGNRTFLLNNIISRFIYELPINPNNYYIIEYLLLSEGKCSFWKLDNKYVITPCSRIGDIDEYGHGKDLFCVTLNGKSKVFKDFLESNEVVYIKNNKMASPDLLTTKDADTLNELMKSFDCLVINSRYTNILNVATENQKKAVEKALKDSDNGVPQVLIAKSLLDDNTNSIEKTELRNVDKTDILQYLSRAYDDTIRRFWNRNGLEVCGTSKLAQQSVDEVSSGHNARKVSVNDMLLERERAIKEINEKFGLNCSVKLAKPWIDEEKEEKEIEITNVEEENNDIQ